MMRRALLVVLCLACDRELGWHELALNGDLSNWTATTPLLQPMTAHGGASYGGYIYSIGGVPDTSEVEMAHPDSSTGAISAWTTATALPDQKAGIAVAAYNGTLYVTGGTSTQHMSNTSSDVFYAQIHTDGSLGAWMTGPQMPSARRGSAATAGNGYLYVIGGGQGANCCLNNVWYSALGANGAPGNWNTAQLPDNVLRASAVTNNGYLYVIAGTGTNNARNTVLYAQIGANGAPGQWTTLTAPWTARRDQAAAAAGGYLYVMGGCSDNNHPPTSELPDVWKAPFNTDGSLGTWATTSAFANPRRSMIAVASGAYLYAFGGARGSTRNSGNRFAEVLVAQFGTPPPPGDGGTGDGSAGTGGSGGSAGSGAAGGAGGSGGIGGHSGFGGNPATGGDRTGFEGCACGVASRPQGPSGFWWLLLVAAAVRLRRSAEPMRRTQRRDHQPNQ